MEKEEFLRLLPKLIIEDNANFSRIENIRSTEFKTLDGKIDSLSEGQDIIKEHIIEIKEMVKKGINHFY